MKNAERLSRRDEILAAFLGRTGHRRGVVALFVDPGRGLECERALEFTEADLRAFLGTSGPLSLMDGLLQKYVHPFGETNIYIDATWEANGNFEASSESRFRRPLDSPPPPPSPSFLLSHARPLPSFPLFFFPG